jgi:alkaline phosphatase D
MEHLTSRRLFLIGSITTVVAACSSSEQARPTATDAAVTATTVPAQPTPTTPAETPTTEPIAETTIETVPLPVYTGTVDPFTRGVASGESVIHWTRLAPADTPLEGLLTVSLEVSSDAEFDLILSTQDLSTDATQGYSVHGLTTGLDPDTWYWYRFRAGEFTSPVGRSRTTPEPGTAADQLTFATASCQHFESGFYTAHADIAAAGVDVVVWLGDYIYEGDARPIGEGIVRTHEGPEPTTLDAYRARYATYKSDANLQAAHAACPWLVIWDDHEVENNYAGNTAQDDTELNDRRAAAYRAWWENTPTRIEAPTTADAVIYRGFEWGSLLDMSLLDTRQYRTDQACNDVTLSTDPPCPETFDTDRTMLGTEQREWLFGRLGQAGATWNALGQQVILGNFMLDGAVLNFDQWDGYPVERDALLQTVVDQQVPNFIVLTGDIHFAGVGNLRAPGGAEAALVGAEFVATSISSGGNVDPGLVDLVKSIGDVVDADLVHRGWIKHTVTPTTWSAEYRIVADALVPDSAVSVFNTYVVEAGTPGIRP